MPAWLAWHQPCCKTAICGKGRSAAARPGRGLRRDHCQRQRHVAGKRQQPGEARGRRNRVVVPPPQARQPALPPPTDRAHPPDRAIRALVAASAAEIRSSSDHTVAAARHQSLAANIAAAIPAMIRGRAGAPPVSIASAAAGRGAAARSIAAARRAGVSASLSRTSSPAPRRASCSARIELLGLAFGGERHQHGPRPRRDHVERRVVAALADRQRGSAATEPGNRGGTARPRRRRAHRGEARRNPPPAGVAPASSRHGASARQPCRRAASAARSSVCPAAPPPAETMTSPAGVPSAVLPRRVRDIAGIDTAGRRSAAAGGKLASNGMKLGSPCTSTASNSSRTRATTSAARRVVAHDQACRAPSRRRARLRRARRRDQRRQARSGRRGGANG